MSKPECLAALMALILYASGWSMAVAGKSEKLPTP
jgi:hypothetical protein